RLDPSISRIFLLRKRINTQTFGNHKNHQFYSVETQEEREKKKSISESNSSALLRSTPFLRGDLLLQLGLPTRFVPDVAAKVKKKKEVWCGVVFCDAAERSANRDETEEGN
ncbi:hypothetical protein RB213_003405, partial [Colletotrichum asianum]